MSIYRHLIHTCTVQRATTEKDPYGNDIATWSTRQADVHCRLVINIQRVLDTATAQLPSVSRYKLFLPAGTTVVKGDRITSLVYEDGTEEDSIFSVEAILPRRANTVRHITLELKKVS